eukprot:c22371_g1_i1 orf=413-1726(+)
MSTVAVGLKSKNPWSAEEDALLIRHIEHNGIDGCWRKVPTRAGLLRSGKSCRLRWMNYLRPGVKHGSMTLEEIDLIVRLHRLLGNRWSLIAGRLPGRTDNEIKNFWKCHLRKKYEDGDAGFRREKPVRNDTKGSTEQDATMDHSCSRTKLLAYNLVEGRQPPIAVGNYKPYYGRFSQQTCSLKNIQESWDVSNIPIRSHFIGEVYFDPPAQAACTTASPSYSREMDEEQTCWFKLASSNPSYLPAPLDDQNLNILSSLMLSSSSSTDCSMHFTDCVRDSSGTDIVAQTRRTNPHPYLNLSNDSRHTSSQCQTLPSAFTPSQEILSLAVQKEESLLDSFHNSAITHPSSDTIQSQNSNPCGEMLFLASLHSSEAGICVDKCPDETDCEKVSDSYILNDGLPYIDNGNCSCPATPKLTWQQHQLHNMLVFSNLCDEIAM